MQQPGAAPTVADANVVDHMERIRAAQSQGGAHSSAAKKRLAGTMVMPNSPPATHPLAPPLVAPMARPPTPAPFQGAAAYAQMPAQSAGQPLSTARMAPYAQQQQQPFPQAPAGSVVPQSGPRSRPQPKKGGGGFLAALLVFFLIVFVGGGAIVGYWYFRMR